MDNIKLVSKVKTFEKLQDCGNHVSLVVGRRQQGGKCQYLVRNTWGTSCSFYKKWECDKDASGQGTGGFWVDAATLLPNTFSVTTSKGP